MESRLETLTQRLYEQGLERGKSEAKQILDKAQGDAGSILAAARQEAEEMLRKAREEAAAIKTRALAEIRLAGDQSLSALRQEIVYLLSRSALEADTHNVLGSADSLLDIIKDAVTPVMRDPAGTRDLAVILPEASRDHLEKVARKRLKEQLDQGMELRFDGRFEHGFRIIPQEGNYQISFTDQDFLSFFQGYLKSRTREILFPEA